MRCTAGDTIQDGTYRWYLSSHCKNCGRAVELDGLGVGELPADVQREIIKESGEWEVFAQNKVSKVIYLMRKILETHEVTKIAEDTCAVYKGTKNQALWIKNRLVEKGIPESDLEVREQKTLS